MTDTPQGGEPVQPQDAAADAGGAGAAAVPPAASPPPPPGPPPRRLVRRHGMIAGVAAGLGDYFDIDPLFFRIGFVVLTFTGGAGVLLYLVMALLMPTEDGRAALGRESWRGWERRRSHRWVGIALIIVAAAIIASGVGAFHAGIVWGVALIVLGVLLFQQETAPWDRPVYAGGPQQPQPPGDAATAGPTAAQIAPASGPPAWTPTPAWGGGYAYDRHRMRHEHRHHHPRSPVGWITVALALVGAGTAALLNSAGVVSMTTGGVLAVALVIIGAGLVASAFIRGRTPGLVLLGFLLLPFTAAASLVDQPLGGGVGDRVFQPHSLAEVHSRYDIAAGRLTLDFSQADLGGAARTVKATVAFGRLNVVVPRDVPVVVHGHVGGGRMDLLGRDNRGANVDDDIRDNGTGDTLTLDLSVGFGEIWVWREGTTPLGVL